MSKKIECRQSIIRHGQHLRSIFPDAAMQDPFDLYRALRKLEAAGNRIGLDLCNDRTDQAKADRREDAILDKLDALLCWRRRAVQVELNRDPRGYALKISHEWMAEHPLLRLHTDWGGYGILAPDFKG